MADEKNEIAIHFDADYLPQFIDMLNRAKIPGAGRFRADGDSYLRFSVVEWEPGEATLTIEEIAGTEHLTVALSREAKAV